MRVAPRAGSIDHLEVAADIAFELCRTALTYEGESTWLGTQQHGNGDAATAFSYATVGADLYGGTSGIALFLAEMYARTGETVFKATSAGASSYALAKVPELPRRFRLGFYAGTLGVAYALARCGALLDRQSFVDAARRLLRDLIDDPATDTLLDVISGAAGAVTPLLALADLLDDDAARELAERLGTRIIDAAEKSDGGWSWGELATGFVARRNLTGFGHGTAGYAWALCELYAARGERRFLDAALEAIRYENSVFVPDRNNWPDYRFADGRDRPAPCGLAWCFGAPGIGLSRLRAYEIHRDDRHRDDARAALMAITRALEDAPSVAGADFSLCHGWAGIGEFLTRAETVLGEAEAGQCARKIAADGSAHGAGTDAWHCGLLRGTSPSLMLGLAGIGHFYLRLAEPAVPSVLLVSPRAW
jgi:lantibiotic modifying enzyme